MKQPQKYEYKMIIRFQIFLQKLLVNFRPFRTTIKIMIMP